jgi:hypothetical protein
VESDRRGVLLNPLGGPVGLREPLKRESNALRKLLASRSIYDGWEDLIRDSSA